MDKKESLRESLVSARLTVREHELVTEEAKRRGMNVTDLVRTALLQQRPDASTTRLSEIETRLAEQDQTIFDLVTAVTELRLTLAKATQALLLSNEGKKENHDTIRQWVHENLLPDVPRAEGGRELQD